MIANKFLLILAVLLPFYGLAQKSPDQIMGLAGWFMADDEYVELDGKGKVAKWIDASGNNLALVQFDETARPTLTISSEINNQPCLQFDGINDYLNGGDILDISDKGQTAFYVFKSTSTTGVIYSKSSSNSLTKRHAIQYTNNSFWLQYHDNKLQKIFGHSHVGDFEMVTNIVNNENGVVNLYKNYTIIDSISITANYNMDSEFQYLVGALNGTDGLLPPYGRYLEGYIAEIIIFQRSVTDQERIQVESYLRQKYFPEKVAPILDLGNDVFIKYGFADTTITAQGGFVKYEWSTGETTPSIVVDTTGYYSLTVTDQYGLVSFDDIYVEYPKVSLDDQLICLGDSIPLSLPFSPENYSFKWSDESIADTVWLTEAGKWAVTVTDNKGNTFYSDTINASVDYFSDVDLLPVDTLLCSGNLIFPQVDAYTVSSFEWSGGSDTFENRITNEGRYTVTVFDENGCKAEDSINISIKGIAPNALISADTVCLGDKTTIKDVSSSDSDIVSRKWTISENEFVAEKLILEYVFSTFGDYPIRLDIENANGCHAYISDTIRVGEIPSADFEVEIDNSGCNTKPLLINEKSSTLSDSIIKYIWNADGNEYIGKDADFNINILGESDVNLTVKTEYGCIDSTEQTVSILPAQDFPCKPHINHPQNGATYSYSEMQFEWENICNTNQLLIEFAEDEFFTQNSEKIWFYSHITSFNKLFPVNKTYWWRIKAYNTCKDSTVSNISSFSIVDPMKIGALKLWLAADNSIKVDEYGGIEEWIDLSGNNNHLIQETTDNRPTLVGNAVNLLPTVRFDGKNDFLTGQNLYADEQDLTILLVHKFDGTRKTKNQYLISQVGDTINKYRIFAPANKNFALAYDVAPPAKGEILTGAHGASFYRLSVINVNNGTTSIYTNRTLDATGSSEDYTGIETEFILGNRYSTFPDNWFAGDIAEVLIYGKGLSDSDQKKIEDYLFTKYRTPAINLGPDIDIPYSLCDTVLNKHKGYNTYQWSDGNISDSLKIRWSGTYGVTVTDHFGLESSDELVVSRNFNQLKDTTICIGNNVVLLPSAEKNYSYTWNNGSIENEQSTISQGTYAVTVTDTIGCSLIYYPVSVSVDRFSLDVGFDADDLDLCVGDTIFPIYPPSPSYVYEWHDGSSFGYWIGETKEGIKVTVTNTNGCFAADSATINIKGSPLTSDFIADTVCYGANTQFVSLSYPDNEKDKQHWYIDSEKIGSGDELKYKLADYGLHQVTMVDTSENGCISSATKSVKVLPSPLAKFSSNQICQGEEITLFDLSSFQDTSTISSYTWVENGAEKGKSETITFLPSSPSLIKLVVENSIGCRDSVEENMSLILSDNYPLVATQLLPADSALIVDSLVDFSWIGGANTYKYQVEISESENFESFKIYQSYHPEINDILINKAGVYYWRIKSFSLCNNYTVSNTHVLIRPEPNLTNGLVCWLDASDGVQTDDNGNVLLWKSKYSDYTITQTNKEKRPTIISDQINHFPVVRFDGINDYLSGLSLGLDSNFYSVFAVHRFNIDKTAGLNTVLNQTTESGAKLLLYSTANSENTFKVQSYPPEKEPAGAIAYGAQYYSISSILSDTLSVEMWHNTEKNTEKATTVVDGTETEFLVGAFSASNTSHLLNGDIAELIIYNRKLSTEEKDSIHNYLIKKFIPKLNIGEDIPYSLCKKELTADSVYINYSWKNGDTKPSTEIKKSGVYKLTATDQFGFIQTDEVTVSRSDLNQLVDTSVCYGNKVEWITGYNDDYSLIWSDNSSNSSLNITEEGNYYYSVSDSLGCSLFSDTVVVAVDSFPLKIDLIANSNACEGELIFVDDPLGLVATYEWNTGTTTSSEIITESGLYSVTAENERGCLSSMEENITMSGTAPKLSISKGNICEKTETVLSATAETLDTDELLSIEWNISGFEPVTGIEAEYFFPSADTFALQLFAETKLGCKGTLLDTIYPKENPAPQIISTKGTKFCINEAIGLKAYTNEYALYKWHKDGNVVGDMPSQNLTISEVGESEIVLEATYNNLCSNTSTLNIEIVENYPVPQDIQLLSPENNTVIMRDSFELFSWLNSEEATAYIIELSTDSLFSEIIFADTVTDTKYEYLEAFGGALFWRIKGLSPCNEDVISKHQFLQLLTPQLPISPQLWIDAGYLEAPDSSKIGNWTPVMGAEPTQTDSLLMPLYIKGAINGHSAIRFDGKDDYMNVGDTNDIRLSGQTVFIVAQNTSTNGTFYSKSKNNNSAKNRYSLRTVDGEIYYQYHNTESKSIFIEDISADYKLYSIRNDVLNGTVDIYCYGFLHRTDSILDSLSIDSGFDFLLGAYNNAQGTTPPFKNAYLNGNIAEMVIYDTTLSSIQIEIVNKYLLQKYFPDMQVVDFGDDIVSADLCPVVLKPDGLFSEYKWSTGDVSESIQVSTEGMYYLTVTNAYGIESNDSIYVDYPGNDSEDIILCLGSSIDLNPNISNEYTYNWLSGETTPSLTVEEGGNYIVFVTDEKGCTKEYFFQVIADSLEKYIYLPIDTSLCQNNSICIDINENAKPITEIIWQDGSSELCIDATSEETYNVEISDINNCKVTHNVNVKLKGVAPQVDFKTDRLCANTPVNFENHSNANSEIISSNWKFGNDLSSADFNSSTIYPKVGIYNVSLEITESGGCTAIKSEKIKITALPEVSTKIKDACIGLPNEIETEFNEGAIQSIVWDMGDGNIIPNNQKQYIYTDAGSYTVSVKIIDTLLCSDSSKFDVTVFENRVLPEIPDIISPSMNKTVYEDSVSFQWFSENADHWGIEICSNSLMQNGIYSEDSLFSSSIKLALPYVDTVYWRVVSYNLCNEGVKSDLSQFIRFSPSIVEDNSLWLIADSIQVIDSTETSVWENISGANNLVQETEGMKPLKINDQLNGHSILEFDGIDDYLDGGNILDISPNGLTAFFVIKSENDKGIIYAKAHKNVKQKRHLYQFYNSNVRYIHFDENEKNISHTASLNEFTLLALYVNLDLGVVTLYENGIKKTSMPVSENYDMKNDYNFLIGALNNTKGTVPPASPFLEGAIAEIIFYNRPLQINEQTQVEQYLRNKYFPEEVIPLVNLGSDVNIDYGFCPVILDAGNSYNSYQWNTGAISQSIEVSSTGQYSVTVIDKYGVSSTDSINVTYPSESFMEKTVCIDDSLLLALDLEGKYSYYWSNGSENESILVNEEGIYSLEVTDSLNICTSEIIFNVSIDSFAYAVTLQDTVTACKWSAICSEYDADKYREITQVWNGNDTSICLKLEKSGIQYYSATNSNGCKVADSVYANLQGEAPNVAFNLPVICKGYPIKAINNSKGSSQITGMEWKVNGEIVSEEDQPQLLFDTAGLYEISLSVKEIGGCIGEYSENITVLNSPDIFTDISQVCLGNETHFHISYENLETHIDSVIWKMGEKDIEYKDIQSYLYEEAGTYYTLTEVYDTNGCIMRVHDSAIVYESYPSPHEFNLIKPAYNQTIKDKTVIFTWEASENAYFYQLLIHTSLEEGDGPLIAIDSIFDTSFELKIDHEEELYWSVVAVNICGDETNSKQSSFAVFNPKLLLGLEGWFIADSIPAINDSLAVLEWNNLINPETSINGLIESAPMRVDGKLNNHAVLEFDGVDDYLNGGDIFDMQPQGSSIFIVGHSENSYGGFVVKSSASLDSKRYGVWMVDGKLKSLVHDNQIQNIISEDDLFSNKSNLISFVVNRDQNIITLYHNRKSEGNITAISSSDMNSNYNFLIGAHNNENGTTPPHPDYYLKGDIAEILIYNRPLSEEERFFVEDYLTKKYFPENVHPDIVLDDELIVPYGYCPQEIAPEFADWHTSYKWSTGSETISTIVDKAGTYYLTVTDQLGVEYVDSIFVSYAAEPVSIAGKKLCFGETLLWDTEVEGEYEFLWSNTSTEPSIEIALPNKYWLVISDTLGCKFETDTIDVLVDSLPLLDVLGGSREVCLNQRISEENADYEFLWSTGSNGNQILIEQEGSYMVTVTSNNDCIVTDSVYFTISGEAPILNPEIKNICDTDTSTLSTGILNQELLNAVRWYAQNEVLVGAEIQKVFDLGENTVSVYSESVDGCSDSISFSFNVEPLPKAKYLPLVACEGAETRFYDKSEAQSGFITNIEWNINGERFSDSLSVGYFFAKEGKAFVEVKVTDSNGCSAVSSDSVVIRPTPKVNFVNTPVCEDQLIFFFNQVETDAYNQIIDYKWLVNGNEIHNSDIYVNSVNVDSLFVSLTAQGLNGCIGSYDSTYLVGKLPVANFGNLEACLGDSLYLADSSTVEKSIIAKYEWYLEDSEPVFVKNPAFMIADTGRYMMQLMIETDLGCVDTTTKEVVIHALPKADFSLYPKFGGAPLKVNFTNNSEGAEKYHWNINGDDDLYDKNPSYTFSNTGSFDIVLTAENEFGCVDSTAQTINTYVSNYNISIDKININGGEGRYNVSVEYQNLGVDIIYSLDFILKDPVVGQVIEHWEGELKPGEKGVYIFEAEIKTRYEDLPDYICVELQVADDASIYYSNEECISTLEDFGILSLHPVPVDDELTVRFNLPVDESYEIIVVDELGKVVIDEKEDGKKGFNSHVLDVSSLAGASYSLVLKSSNNEAVALFVKRSE